MSRAVCCMCCMRCESCESACIYGPAARRLPGAATGSPATMPSRSLPSRRWPACWSTCTTRWRQAIFHTCRRCGLRLRRQLLRRLLRLRRPASGRLTGTRKLTTTAAQRKAAAAETTMMMRWMPRWVLLFPGLHCAPHAQAHRPASSQQLAASSRHCALVCISASFELQLPRWRRSGGAAGHGSAPGSPPWTHATPCRALHCRGGRTWTWMTPQQQLLPSREGRWWMTMASRWCIARAGVAPGSEPPAQWTAGRPLPSSIVVPDAVLLPALCPSAASFVSTTSLPLVGPLSNGQLMQHFIVYISATNHDRGTN